MKKIKQWSGYLYLPSNSNHKVQGRLIFDPNSSIELELFGIIFNDKVHLQNYDEFILGEGLNEDFKITITNSFHKRNEGYPISKQLILVNNFFDGIHVNSFKELNFNEINISSNQIDSWFDYKTYNYRYSNNFKNYQLTYDKPQDIEFEIAQDIKGKVLRKLNVTQGKNSEHILNQNVTINIRSEDDIPFIELHKLALGFSYLLNVFINSNIYITKEVLTKDSCIRTLNGGSKIPISILFYSKQPTYRMNESVRFFNEVVRFNQVEKSLKSYLENYYKLYHKIKPIIQIVSFNNMEKEWNENSFLNMVQGLESFHSRFRIDNLEYPSDEIKLLADSFLSKLSDENHIDWFEKSLKNRKKSIRTRIMELLIELNNFDISEFNHLNDDYIKKIVLTRNYYTHYNPKHESKILKDEEFFDGYVKMKRFLVSILLKEIGIDLNEIKDGIRNIY